MKKRINLLATRFIVLTLLAVWFFPPLIGISYGYATLQNRSISILSSVGGANTVHSFTFSFAVPVNVASLQFQYCTDPISDVSCVTPTGLDVSAANLDSQSGETGFSVLSSSTNTIILTRTLGMSDVTLNAYQFSNVVNPDDVGPFFVRISSYPTSDASGAYNAFSSVAASINTGININAEVPQILYFCSAVTIPTDCSSATGDFIDLSSLLATTTRYSTSQFLVGTNAPNGYNVNVNGPTMSSGTDTIAALAVPTINKVGRSQFGINLRANLTPLVGAELTGGSGSVTANYNNANLFTYVDGDIVATGPGPSDIGKYTVSYIVNVPTIQPPGIYNTTITYICTAGF